MRVVVVGAGGVGGLLAGLLARGGTEVALLARGRHLEAIGRDGLRVESPLGNFAVRLQAADDPAALGRADTVLVAVKTWQVAEVAPSLRPLLGTGTVVVPLENGVEASDTLAHALGEGSVGNGIIAVMSSIAGPGAIRHVGFTPRMTVGERRRGPSERLERLCQELKRAGVEARVADDVQVPLWQKFIFIDPFGTVAAATRSTAGELRSVPESRALLASAMREVEAVARARGVALPADTVDQALATVDSFPAEATASMQRDIQGGRRSELLEQTGAVVRLGRAAGVPTPVHEVLLACLLPQEGRARRPASG